MIILEIIQEIFQGFLGIIKAAVMSIPDLLEIKENLNVFTPSGMFTEYIKYLNVPVFLVTIVPIVVAIFKRYEI